MNRKKKILLIEDDENFLTNASTLIENWGYDVSTLTSGYNVMQTILKIKPALIIMDIWLPGLNGIELCKMITDNPKTNNPPIIVLSGEAKTGILDDASLAIAATDDHGINEAVSREAQRLGTLVNVVDDPELCTFFMPAVARKGDLVISVSTSGKSPALSRCIREELEACFGEEYAALVDLMGELRKEIRAAHADPEACYQTYRRILGSDVPRLLAQGRRDEALETARKCI